MPLLIVKVAPLQNPEHYRAIAQGLTALSTEILDKRPEVTTVVVDDLPQARWAIGGLVPERPVATLEIHITVGTNTPAQKAAFVAQAHACLNRLVGQGQGLAEASYVLVHELPATDWGYGGHTQAARRLAREAQALV